MRHVNIEKLPEQLRAMVAFEGNPGKGNQALVAYLRRIAAIAARFDHLYRVDAAGFTVDNIFSPATCSVIMGWRAHYHEPSNAILWRHHTIN